MDLKSQCFLKHNPAHQPAKPWMSNRQATQTSLAGDVQACLTRSLCVPVLVNNGVSLRRDRLVQFLALFYDLRVHFLLWKGEENIKQISTERYSTKQLTSTT